MGYNIIKYLNKHLHTEHKITKLFNTIIFSEFVKNGFLQILKNNNTVR